MTSLPNKKFSFTTDSDEERSSKSPYIVGVCGGSGSGKTSVCKEIIKKLHNKRVSLLSQDWFYRTLNEKELENVSEHDWDDPSALDQDLLYETLKKVKQGVTVTCPKYDFCNNRPSTTEFSIVEGDVILFEGIHIFHTKELRDLIDIKVFVDVDDDIRLGRRIIRDTKERGRTAESIINQYFKFVKPGFDNFVSPTKKFADIILLRGSSNKVAISLLVQQIKAEIDNRNSSYFNNIKKQFLVEKFTLPKFDKILN
ncbi:uridine kinase [Anaeramoeba flamelloides]|uniref:uridine/cytidine kinase n=1 Tax=Anaeramoeba flamelloides TaxID=1746091 RepID=A0AAV8AID7_9EUKA|nr:uridine kinase [Anaeramoeba flamelloides]KAJ6255517.1 uridine kinase [Anaeramoeba flamelloides]